MRSIILLLYNFQIPKRYHGTATFDPHEGDLSRDKDLNSLEETIPDALIPRFLLPLATATALLLALRPVMQ